MKLNRMDIESRKREIIEAGREAIDELVKVAKEAILDGEDDLTADKLKNAAATKKLAIFDAFEILKRIDDEEKMLNGEVEEKKEVKKQSTFAEKHAKSNK